MPYKFEHVDEGVRAWSLADDGGTTTTHDADYRPACYVAHDARDEEALATVRGQLT